MKRFIGGILAGLMIVAIGIGIFIPKKKVQAAASKGDIIEYFGNDFRYEISFRDNISIIMVYNDDEVFTFDDVIYCPDEYDRATFDVIKGLNINGYYDGHRGYNIKFSKSQFEKLIPKEGCIATLVFSGKDLIDINGISLTEIEKEYGYKDDLLFLDIDDNGQVNILDAQMLLTYILEVQMESYEYSDEGFYQFKKDYLNERKVINEE